MTFIKRLIERESITAARRGRASDQLQSKKRNAQNKKASNQNANDSDVTEPRPPAKLLETQPENLVEPLPPAPVKEDDKVSFTNTDSQEDFDEDEDPTDPSHVFIGKKNCKPRRFSRIRGWKPWLVVISGHTDVENLQKFFKDAAGTLANEAMVELLMGKQPKVGVAGIDSLYAYLATEPAARDLENKAKLSNLGVEVKEMGENIAKSNPFYGINFGTKFQNAIGGNSQALWNALDQALAKLRKCDGEEVGGTLMAIQMNSAIPLNYLRFLSTQHVERQFYIGDQPVGAGLKGRVYALCTEQEADNFRNEMKHFGHPPLFYQDLVLPLPDIDPGFKSQNIEPRKILPANATIIRSNVKFDLKKIINEGSDVTFLDTLNWYATHKMSKAKGHKSAFLKGSMVQGTFNLHFNAAMNQCIIWGTTSPMSVDEAELKRLFEVVEVNKRYSK